MKRLYTTRGPLSAEELEMILPHEHIFVDLRTWDQPGYAQAPTEEVIALMSPEIEKARAAGVTALVECSTVGVGRRADILKAVSQSSGFPIVVPTGAYRDKWIPPWIRNSSEEALREWMIGELTGQIEDSGVPAGWIKLGASDEGLTETEKKLLRAAAGAGRATNAVIGSHTIHGSIAREQLDIIEGAGHSAERFIWIHTQNEEDFGIHLELSRRGAWIEYDNIGQPGEDARHIDRIRGILDAGLDHRLLLSHDRGWYDPAKPGGGTPEPFTYLSERFLPQLREAGVDEATVRQLTRTNPYRALSR